MLIDGWGQYCNFGLNYIHHCVGVICYVINCMEDNKEYHIVGMFCM